MVDFHFAASSIIPFQVRILRKVSCEVRSTFTPNLDSISVASEIMSNESKYPLLMRSGLFITSVKSEPSRSVKYVVKKSTTPSDIAIDSPLRY